MKKLFFLFTLMPFKDVTAQRASAGGDVIIYLTSTNKATLDGSASSGRTFQWSEISTDYSSGATISNATSKVASVSPLPQGVFYFQITVDGVLKDTMVVRVRYAPARGEKLLEALSMSTIAGFVNARNDTSDYIGYVKPNNPKGIFGHNIWLERSRLPDMYIDTLRGKCISTIEDGYGWNGYHYARTEAFIGSKFNVDSNHIYDIRFQGYFPQHSYYLDETAVRWSAAVVFMQIHGSDTLPPPLSFNIGHKGNLYVALTGPAGNLIDSLTIGRYADWVNHAHTIDVFWKESQFNGFVKVLVDGIEKYYHAGIIGRVPSGDYFKFLSLYDYGNWMVDVHNHHRKRKFSLVTTDYRIYSLSETKNSEEQNE